MLPQNFHPREDPITTIVLADDDTRFRDYLRTLLARERSVEVIGEAGDGMMALELVNALEPKLLLLDLAMPGLNGIETTRRALSVRPDLKVLIISLHSDRQMVTAALEAGASGYLLKDRLGEELSKGLAEVIRGGTYLSVDLVGPTPPSGHVEGPESDTP